MLEVIIIVIFLILNLSVSLSLSLSLFGTCLEDIADLKDKTVGHLHV